MGHMGVLRLYKIWIFAEVQFLQAVPTPNSSFMHVNSLRLLSCFTQPSPLKNKNIRLYFYIYIFLTVCHDPAVENNSLLWELIIYEFKLGYNAINAIKNIHYVKGESAVDHSRVTIIVQEISLKLQEPR